MDQNIELLNFIYQNVESSINGLNSIIKIMQDKHMKNLLKKHVKDYKMVLKETEHKIKEYGKTPRGISKLKEIKSYFIIKINTLWSGTKDYVSGILIKVTNDAINEVSIKIRESVNANKKVIDIANKLLNIEKRNLEELREI